MKVPNLNRSGLENGRASLTLRGLAFSLGLLTNLGVLAAEVGEKAPSFALVSLTRNETVSLDDFKGKVVILDFWASWCGPCIQEMPALDKLAQKYQMLGVQVWGVNVENDSKAALAYLNKVPVGFPVLFDVDNSVSKAFQVEAMPTTVIIDKNGAVRSVHRGYQPGYEKKYENDIKGLLRE